MRLRVLLMTVVALASTAPVNREEKGSKTQNTQNVAKDLKKSGIAAGSSVSESRNGPSERQPDRDSSEKQSQNYLSVLFGPNNLPTIALVLVGFWTLRIIWMQAIETRKAADAALLTAQAMIDAERPWFVPVMERYEDERLGTLYRVRITNRGRSPGHLWALESQKIFAAQPSRLPLPPSYEGSCYAPNSRFIATDQSFTDRERIVGYSPDFMLAEGGRKQFEFLILYGRVTYKDTFTGGRANEVIHESKWCYFWDKHRRMFIACGPDEYNGYRDHLINA